MFYKTSCAKVGHLPHELFHKGPRNFTYAHKVYRCPSVLSLLKCLSFLVGLGIHVPEGHGAIRAKIGPGANFRSAFSFQCHASPCLETKVLVPVPEHCRRCLTRLCVFGKQLMSTTAQQTDKEEFVFRHLLLACAPCSAWHIPELECNPAGCNQIFDNRIDCHLLLIQLLLCRPRRYQV